MSDEKAEGKEEATAPNYAVVVRRAALLEDAQWNDERIATVLRMVCPPKTPPAAMAMFLSIASRYGLDPLAQEIWLAPDDQGRLKIITGRNSFLKVARRDPDFMGHESGVVYAKDIFEVAREGGVVHVKHGITGFDRGKIIGAFCRVRLKTRPDIYVQRPITAYGHLMRKTNWAKYPEEMLETRCIVVALRFGFNIAGVEMPDEDTSERETTEQQIAEHTSTNSIRERVQELAARRRQEPSKEPEAATVALEEEVPVDAAPDEAADPREPGED